LVFVVFWLPFEARVELILEGSQRDKCILYNARVRSVQEEYLPDLKGAKFLGPKDRDHSSFKVSKENLVLLLEL